MRPPRAPASAPSAAAPARAPVTPLPFLHCLLCSLPAATSAPKLSQALSLSQAGSARAGPPGPRIGGRTRVAADTVEVPAQGIQRRGGATKGMAGDCVSERVERVWGPNGTACAEAGIFLLWLYCSCFSFLLFARLPLGVQASCRSLRAC